MAKKVVQSVYEQIENEYPSKKERLEESVLTRWAADHAILKLLLVNDTNPAGLLRKSPSGLITMRLLGQNTVQPSPGPIGKIKRAITCRTSHPLHETLDYLQQIISYRSLRSLTLRTGC